MHLIIQTLAMAYYGFYGPLEVTQDGMNFELLSNSDYPNPDVFYDDTVETAYKVYVCPRGNLLYFRPYFISNLMISVNISFLLKPPAYPHGKSLFTSHFELNS